MKIRFLAFLTVVLLASNAFTQSPTVQAKESISVDITKLSQSELQLYQSLKKKEAENNGDLLDKVLQIKEADVERYASIGKAFGAAFKECWTAISTDAEKFAQSDAGKLTMFLVAWKIMAKDMLEWSRFIVGLLILSFFLFAIIPVWVWSYRKNCMVTSVLVAKESMGFFPWQCKKTYSKNNPNSTGMDHFGALIVLIIVVAIIVGILI